MTTTPAQTFNGVTYHSVRDADEARRVARNAAHADQLLAERAARSPAPTQTIKAVPGADPRFQIKRCLVGYAYAANGNVHNPTPCYTWVLLLDGKPVDHDSRRMPLVNAARSNGQDYIAEAG